MIQRDQAIKLGSEPVFDRSTVIAGFADTVQYMEGSILLSNEIFADSYIGNAERAGLERRIRQITRWRVNRFRVGCDEDFLMLGEFVAQQADLDFRQLQAKLKTLLDNWGFTHAKIVGSRGAS